MYGSIIKLERINQKLKQSNLARGICTSSYLSKIENNLVDPNIEIIYQLFEKLKLDTKLLNKKNKEDIQQLDVILQKSFELAIMEKNFELVEKIFLNSFESIKFQSTEKLTIDFNLIGFRISFMDKAFSQFNYEHLHLISKNFNDHQQFTFNICLGIQSYQKGEIDDSLFLFEKSESLMTNNGISQWEVMDYLYMYALILYNKKNFFKSLNLINKAVNYFKENLYFNRLVDCYILIGLINIKNKDFNGAQKALTHALKITDKFNLIEFYGIIYHNFGMIMFNQNDYESSSNFLRTSLTFKGNNESKLLSLIQLTINSYHCRDLDECKAICDSGLSILENMDTKHQLYLYKYQFEIYKLICINSNELVPLLQKSITYFEEHNYINSTIHYAKILGKILYNKKKYKDAAFYFSKVIELDNI